jgi:alpha-ketoglutarate-dependent taurine dioxygenase
MTAVHIESIKPHIGGIVHVAKADLFNAATFATIREALETRGVLVFPRIDLNDTEQLALTDGLGVRGNYNRRAPGSDAAEKDVYAVTLDTDVNRQPEYVLGTFFWHIDGVTIDQPLPKATLLSASCPPRAGTRSSPAPTRPTRIFPAPKSKRWTGSRSSTRWRLGCDPSSKRSPKAISHAGAACLL